MHKVSDARLLPAQGHATGARQSWAGRLGQGGSSRVDRVKKHTACTAVTCSGSAYPRLTYRATERADPGDNSEHQVSEEAGEEEAQGFPRRWCS